MPSNLTVLAVGGNSLIKEKNKIALSFQYESVKETSKFIADLVEAGLDLVITHGNGPQVGFIYRRGEIAVTELPLVPLDICAADTQGAIKYMFEKALMNEFRKRGIERKIAAVVTQTLVDGNDPAFENPSKPIGSFMSEEEAEAKKKESGWELMEDAGRGYRRVVPSPLPVEIIELEAIKLLVKNGPRCRRRGCRCDAERAGGS
jgi:carbamate kinase